MSVSADRPDPSSDEPTEAPSDEHDDGSTNKHRRDPTLLGIPQREPRRGGWFEAGARSTDPRLKLPEYDGTEESRSGWNSVAERPRKGTESLFPAPRSKVPPPPSVSARKVPPSRKKRISSTPPPHEAQVTTSAKSQADAQPPAKQEGFVALGDPDAKNERLPSLAPQRPSEKLVGLSEPPASPDGVVAPPSPPPEHAATTVDSSPPELEPPPEPDRKPSPESKGVAENMAGAETEAEAKAEAPSDVEVEPDAPAMPEDPALEAAKTTIDDRAPELVGATPLAPIAAADIGPKVLDQAPIAPFQMDDDDDLLLKQPSSNRKWIVAGALVIAAIVGVLVWKRYNPTVGQPVQVIDKVAPAQNTSKTDLGEDRPAGSPTQAASQSSGSETARSEVDPNGDQPSGTIKSGEDRSLVEIMKGIEDANVPSQSRSIARMRAGAKARKARAHLARATTHFRKKRFDHAIRYYVKALVFVPGHEEASEGIMRSLEARDELDKALSWSKRLVQLDSKNAMYWSYVGDLLRKLKRPDDARVMYERALKENRKNKAAVAGLKAIGKR